MSRKKRMPEADLPDQTIVNLEAYLMGTNPPSEVVVNFAKMVLELRRRRFDAIENKLELEWRRNFRQYGKHLPVCELLLHPEMSVSRCTCGFMHLMERAKVL